MSPAHHHALFFDSCIERNILQIIFNHQIAGRGAKLPNVNGIADPPERRNSARGQRRAKTILGPPSDQPRFRDSALETEHVESDENQLAGNRPLNRYSIYAGRFTVTDYFDDNAYTHDPAAPSSRRGA